MRVWGFSAAAGGAVALGLATLFGAAAAQTVTLAAPDATAAAGISYGALLALAFPGAHLQGQTLIVPGPLTLHHLQDDEMDDIAEPAPVTLVQAMPVMLDGQAHLAILADLGPSEERPGDVTVLALFGLDPAPALVDLVEVDTDRMTGFGSPAAVSTGPGDSVLLIDNSHADAGQGYHDTTLIALSGAELRRIDTVAMLDLLVCGYRLEQHLTLASDPKSPLPAKLTALVAETVTADTDCTDDPQPMPKARTFAVTYARDPATGDYAAKTGDWSGLDAVNAQRY